MTNAVETVKTRGEPIRVFLLDDHEHVLWGLTKLIDGEWPRMMVIGSSTDMTQASALIQARKPDVIVLDAYVDGARALDTMTTLAAAEGVDAVVLTGAGDTDMRRRALRTSAKSVIEKDAPGQVLLREIERLHRQRRAPNAAP